MVDLLFSLRLRWTRPRSSVSPKAQVTACAALVVADNRRTGPREQAQLGAAL